MRTLSRLLALTVLTLSVAACGAEINAVVGAGSVSLTPAGGESAVANGPISFVDGTTLEADSSGARVRVALGGSVAGETTTGGDPEAGIVDFDLTDGTKFRRRAAAMFDLDEGIAHVRGGPMRMRVVVFHGTCFAEILPEKNTEGVSVHLITQGDQLKAEVEKGEVLLYSTGTSQKDRLYVTLGEGETSVAKPGEAPEKGATDWYDSE